MKKYQRALTLLLAVLLCAALLAGCGQKPAAPAEDAALHCTISISCATLLDHSDQLAKEKAGLVPADGCLLPATQAAFSEGESAFDLLQRVCRENKIPLDFDESAAYGAFIKGIGNIYQGDCGDLSYWMYSVNGAFLNCGCSQYTLCEGDEICLLYTCDLGADIGAEMEGM